jgi:hypothetical protein
MKVEVKKLAEEFKPVTVTITFEKKEELHGHIGGFVTRMDTCYGEEEGGNYMSLDPTCQAIRKALKEAGY